MLDKVTWMARVKNDPALFVTSVDAAPVNLNRDASLNNLCTGASNCSKRVNLSAIASA